MEPGLERHGETHLTSRTQDPRALGQEPRIVHHMLKRLGMQDRIDRRIRKRKVPAGVVDILRMEACTEGITSRRDVQPEISAFQRHKMPIRLVTTPHLKQDT